MKDICSVKDYPKNGKVKKGFSVLAGVFVGAAIALPVWLLAAVLINPDEGLSESKVIWSVVIIAFGFIAGSFAGGYTTAGLSSGNVLILLFFTAAILLCLFLFSIDFYIRDLSFIEWSLIVSIPVFVFLGGLYKVRRRKRKLKDNPSFPPGTEKR